MDPASISLSGAVQLNPRPAASPAGASPGAVSAYVVDVTEADFETVVLQRSSQVPVVIDFWAEWCGPCKQLSPILEKLAVDGGGAWILAKIDVDANPRLAQAAQVQGIPAVKAIVNGQVVAEFTGALPENQVSPWIGQLVQAARQGTFGPMAGAPVGDAPGGEPQEEQVDPDLNAADEALLAGDLAASEEAYRRLHDRPDASPVLRAEARSGLARVGLLRRSETLDPTALQRAVQEDPDDPDAVVGLVDVLVLSERADEAFALLLGYIRRSAGEQRDLVRKRLLELFELLGDEDPLVPKARRELASALF